MFVLLECEMSNSKIINSFAAGAILLGAFMPVSSSGAEKTKFLRKCRNSF